MYSANRRDNSFIQVDPGVPVNIVRGLQAPPQVIYFQTSGSGSTGQRHASFIFTSMEHCGSYIKEIAVFTNSV